MKNILKLSLMLLLSSLFLAGCVTEIEPREQAMTVQGISYFKPLSTLDIPDEATIVALGEATHGNHEFKELATEIFKRLVLEKGFRAFAIEAPFGNCVAINDYVLYGIGTAKDVVSRNGFWVHNFQEVVDLVEWMREYNVNAAENDKLRFYGYDIKEVIASGGLFLDYLHKVDAEKAEYYEAVIRNVLDLNVSSVSKPVLRDALEYADGVIADAELNREAYIQASSESDYDFAMRNALCVRNTIEFALLLNGNVFTNVDSMRESFNHRDKCMFENVRWIVEQEESLGRGKVFVFAHNGHIRESEYMTMHVMGQHLSSEYGDRYFTIGTNYYMNTFLAIETGKGLLEGSLANDMGELINLFIDSETDIGVLDIKKNLESGGEMAIILNKVQTMGTIGSVFSPYHQASVYTEQLIPASTYDAMILVRTATPATFVK